MVADGSGLRQFLVLTLTFAACTVISHLCYVGLVRSMRGWFADRARARLFNRLSAGLYVLLGVGLLRLRNHTA
jgi:homoserine/homoserine lactone efflux protein